MARDLSKAAADMTKGMFSNNAETQNKPKTAYEEMQERKKNMQTIPVTVIDAPKENKTITVHATVSDTPPERTQPSTHESTIKWMTKSDSDNGDKSAKRHSDYLKLALVTDKADYKSYVATMAGLKGVSMTAYIQNLIEQDMEKNRAVYDQIKNLVK